MTNIMKKFKRRSFGSASRLEQSNEEAPPLDLSKDAAENMKELLTEITKKEHMATTKRMGYLNNFSQFVRSVPPTSNFGFTSNEIVACLRVALVSPSKEVRAAGFRAFRHLLTDEENMNVFLQQRLDIFIAKSLDLPPAAEVERVQALRLVRKMTYLCPQLFPMSLAMSLAAIGNDNAQDKDRMSRACLATLCELAVQNIEIAAYAGVIGAVVRNVLDCSVPRMNESWVCTILYLFNHPKFRCYVRPSVGIDPLLAPFIDIHYTHSSDISDNMIKEDRMNRLSNAKLALFAIMRSWSGLVFLCDGGEDNALVSILGAFRLPFMEVRRKVIDLLYDTFCLRQPTNADTCVEALHSVDPSCMQDSWKLSESFLIGEGHAVLPHRAQSSRTNLLESYLSILLCAFFDAGIIDSLIEVITTSDDDICLRGSILLGELLHMGNMLLPSYYSSQTHCLPTLMSSAINLEKTPTERGKASAAIGYLHQLHQMKKRGAIANSLFMEQLITQASNMLSNQSKSKNRQDKEFMWKDNDEVQAVIRDTQIMSYDITEFHKWNWGLISTILESPKVTNRSPDEPLFSRFIKRLSVFYKPLQKLYSAVKCSDPMARKYSEVALELTDFLLRKEEQPEGERVLLDILQDIRDSLGEATQTGIVTGILSSSNLNETLSRDYFLIVGKLSSSSNGEKVLEKIPGIFQYLIEICSMSSRESLVKLIISCLDYGRDGIARILLSKSLSSNSLNTRLYATQFLRILLRVKSPYFSNWGIEFLTNQLYDEEGEVVEVAIDILEEACEDEANLQRLIEVKPHLLHLGEKGIRLLSRYVSVSRGFTYLQDMDYLSQLIEAWKTNYNREYVNWIELELTEALTAYEKHGSEGGYVRRTNDRFAQRRDVYVLPHLYGELAKHRYGIQKIQEEGLLTDSINVIVQQVTDTSYDIFQLKAALWSIGQIGSSNSGINLLISIYKRSSQSTQAGGSNSATPKGGSFTAESYQETPAIEEEEVREEAEEEEQPPDVIELIVTLASQCEVYTIRGTCFYVLGLLASTPTGADKLEELGWECVRHKGSDIWPVIEHDLTYYWEPEYSEDEEDNEESVEIDSTPIEPAEQDLDPNHDMLSGVYLGDDFDTDMMEIAPPSFDYTILQYKKKGKKAKLPTSDESRYLQTMASITDDSLESNMKIKFFDVDSAGLMYEKEDESLLKGLDRMHPNILYPRFLTESAPDASGIFFGDDDASESSEQISSDTIKTYKSADEFMPFLLGLSSGDLTSPENSVKDDSNSSKTKPIFDDAGIYLGEEDELGMTPDDSIEANLSSLVPSPPQPVYIHEHKYFDTSNEPLKPIREEKSQESLDSKSINVIDISIEEAITVEVNKREMTTSESSDTSTLDSIAQNDEKVLTHSVNSYNLDENSRYRSVSLNEGPPKRFEPNEVSPRSSSFSGTAMHNKATVKAQRQTRSDSDPLVGANSLTNSISSQESDKQDNYKQTRISNRKKSRSETEDANDRDRSHSILSDGSSNGAKLIMAKRLRGASTISLGVSPKSMRGFSMTPSDVSSYTRESGGYNAWATLKKQRSFKKELDATLRRSSCNTIGERRKSTRSLAYNYRRLMSNGSNSGGGRKGNVHAIMTRRQISSTPSNCSGLSSEIITNDLFASSEDYVGRCLPSNLSDFFKIEYYDYTGSWADNFEEFCESRNLQTFNMHKYEHIKERCIVCGMKIDPKTGKLTKIMDMPKSRSSSKDTPENDVSEVTDEDSESSSGRGGEEITSKLRINVHKEVLKLVVNMSSAVAVKGTQQEIIALRSRYPWAFQDLCLYSQVMEQLGVFTFRLTIRRFIQALFEGVSYSTVFEIADIVLGRNKTNDKT